MAPGVTKAATEVSTRGISWEYKQSVNTANNIITILFQLSRNDGSFNERESLGFVQNCIGTVITLTFDTHGSVHRRLLSRNTNKMHLYMPIW
jgi:hypothetical protein